MAVRVSHFRVSERRQDERLGFVFGVSIKGIRVWKGSMRRLSLGLIGFGLSVWFGLAEKGN